MRTYKLLQDENPEYLEEVERLSVFDKDFEDFLDSLNDNNEVEYEIRNG